MSEVLSATNLKFLAGTRDVDDSLLVFLHHRAIYPVRNYSGGNA